MKVKLVKDIVSSLLFACAFVSLVAATAPLAQAARPEPASGEFFPCFNYAGPPRQVGENLIITFNISNWRTSTGTLIGTAEGTELDVFIATVP